MEYVDGEDLGTLLRRIGRLPSDKATQIARQTCAGLAAAHEKGVLHRDLKPANIMIDGRGHVRLMDFGLAGLAEELKHEGSRAGTPAYMAPEQLQAKGVTTRSDVYSLGLVLYEVFTGKPAYRPQSMAELAQMHERPLPTLATIVPDIPTLIDQAVMRCIERDPAARHGSVMGVAAALGGQDLLAAALAAGEMPSPELVAASGGKGALRTPVAAGVLVAILIGLLTIAGINPTTRLYEVDHPEHPNVLIDRARAVLKRVGADLPAGDQASGFSEARKAPDAEGSPPPSAAMRFWYRQSPESLVPIIADQPVGPDHPPRDRAGMNLVVLDSQGRLVRLETAPAGAPKDAGEAPDFAGLLALAAVPQGEKTNVPASVVPRVAADTRAAWEWRSESGSITHCEAASVGSTPVYFEVFTDWNASTQSAGTQGSAQASTRAEAFLSGLFIYLVVYGGPLTLAWYNLRLGRGDRRGAMRLAIAAFSFSVLAWVLKTRFVLDDGLLRLFPAVLGSALYEAGLLWVLYIGIEPFIRRTWPQSLISWSRLLAGDARDGLVGRDLLFGCAMGVAWTLLVQVLYAWGGGDRPLPMPIDPETLGGLRRALGLLLDISRDAVLYPLVILMLVPIARTIVRNLIPPDAVVFIVLALVLAVLLVAQTGRSQGPGLSGVAAAGLILAGVTTYVLRRLGALMLMAAFLTAGVLASFPLTLDTSKWFFGSTAVAVLGILGLAGYGFRRTIAKHPTRGWTGSI
jgi:serine/threonine-protein kinase